MKIGSVGGTTVHLHWTLSVLVLAYVVSVVSTQGWQNGLAALALAAGLVASVLAHELGHVLAARRFGVSTRDILLLPFGGLARLERSPDRPRDELLITLAGPAVNFVLAAVFWCVHQSGWRVGSGAPGWPADLGLLGQLMIANLILGGFNLLPAFPMDGGRILRSLLAMRMGNLRATQIAARVGRWLALFMAIVAIVRGPLALLLLAAFVFVAGTLELLSVRFREMSKTQSEGAGHPRPFGQGGWTATWTGGRWQTQAWSGNEKTANGEPGSQDPDVIDAEFRRIE